MARNVGKTHMEEDLSRAISANQGKILLVIGGIILAALLFSSRDYFSQSAGVVESIGLQEKDYTVRKRTHRKIQVVCARVRLDGEQESVDICNEDPQVFAKLKPRHRFLKARFRRYMEAVGEEVAIPWLEKAAPVAPAPATPPAAPATPPAAPATPPAAPAAPPPAPPAGQ